MGILVPSFILNCQHLPGSIHEFCYRNSIFLLTFHFCLLHLFSYCWSNIVFHRMSINDQISDSYSWKWLSHSHIWMILWFCIDSRFQVIVPQNCLLASSFTDKKPNKRIWKWLACLCRLSGSSHAHLWGLQFFLSAVSICWL